MTSLALPVVALLLTFNPAALPARVGLLENPRGAQEVHQAVLTGVRDRGWVVQADGPEVVARLDHRGISIVVGIAYEPTRYVIRGLECTGTEKHYEKYVANLDASIRKAVLRLPVAPVVQQEVPPPPPGYGSTGAPMPTASPQPALAIFAREQRPENVRVVILNALNAHRWVVEQEDRNGIIARQTARNGFARVRVTGTTQQATITYVDSGGISIDPQTGRAPEYEKWVRSLISAFDTYTQQP